MLACHRFSDLALMETSAARRISLHILWWQRQGGEKRNRLIYIISDQEVIQDNNMQEIISVVYQLGEPRKVCID